MIMGFYIRKSFRAGPVRLNLSKSGFGISSGIPGFRVGSGPRGNYVHMGLGGLYYRQFARDGSTKTRSGLVGTDAVAPSSPLPVEVPVADAVADAFVDVAVLRDSSNEALLNELNTKSGVWRVFPFGAIGLLASLVLAFKVSALVFVPVTAALLVALPLLWRRDMERTTTTLLYDMDATTSRAYANLCAVFSDWKRYLSGGSIPKPLIPPRLATNIKPYHMTSGKTHLYFFPDQVLVRTGQGYGAVRYGDVNVELTPITHQGPVLPLDARLLQTTWTHARKDGEADLRYKHNPPIYIFEIIRIQMRMPGDIATDTALSGFHAADGLAGLFSTLADLAGRTGAATLEALRRMSREMLADDRLDIAEIKALVKWFRENRDMASQSESAKQLMDTLDEVVADGKITPTERGRLEAALAAVY